MILLRQGKTRPDEGRVFYSLLSGNAKTDGLAGAAFLLLLLAAVAIYFPGLSGTFLHDDSLSLTPLENIGDPPGLLQLAHYSLSGMAGGLGRPLSLATFALQYYSWPSDPTAFKYVNLMLHLLNGCLLFWLLLRVGGLLAWPRRKVIIGALLTAGLWLLHPLQVSTVLYVVQRMTELSALFSLAALLAYVAGRQRAMAGASLSGYAWMSLAVVLGSVFATFAKENGALLPLLVLVLEFTLFTGLPRPRHWRIWQAAFLYAPILLLVGFFVLRFDALILETYKIRDFTLGERLLTEPRILMDYLGKLALPAHQSFSVFHDDFPVSRSLFDPPATLGAALAVAALIGSALWLRRRLPVYSFGVLWFFAGHLLESSFIPLELYYEHRNYLPGMGALFAATHYGMRLYGRISDPRLRRGAAWAAALLLGAFGTLTWMEARLWGHPLLQAQAWSVEHPESKRAQGWAGAMWAASGNPDWAMATYSHLSKIDPGDASGPVFLLHLGCYYSGVTPPERRELVARLASSKFSTGILSGLDEIIALKEQGGCTRVSNRDLETDLETLLANPNFARRSANLFFMQGRLQAAEGDVFGAVGALDRAYALFPRIQTILLQTRWLSGAGRYDEALARLAKAREANARHNGIRRQVQEHEIAIVEQEIARQRASEAAAGAG